MWKSILLQAGILFLIGILSCFCFFVDSSFHCLIGKTCVGELLLMFLAAASTFLLIHIFKRGTYLKDYKFEIAAIFLNFLILLPSFDFTGKPMGIIRFPIFIFVHFLVIVFTSKFIDNHRIFSCLYGFMIFCSPIAYRIAAVSAPPPFWDGESRGAVNVAMLISVAVLFAYGISVVIYKTYSNEYDIK